MLHHHRVADPFHRAFRTPAVGQRTGTQTDASQTVATYLNTRLAQIGVGHVFAIPGDYVAEWVETLDDPDASAGLVRIHPNNEMCATYAADGYGRSAAGTVGCVAFTYGVGALNAIQAVGGAFVERVPLVVINGSPSVAQFNSQRDQGVLYHHLLDGSHSDQRAFTEVTEMAVRIDDPATAPDLIDAALRTCVTKQRPVYIEISNGVTNLPCRDVPDQSLLAASTNSVARPATAPPSLAEATAAVLAHLRQAKRVVLMGGAELSRFDLSDRFAALVKAIDAPYVTSALGKGVLSELREDVRFGGVYFGRSAQSNVQDLVKQADCLLALGVLDTDFNYLGVVTPDYNPDADQHLPGPTHIQAKDGAVMVGRGLAYWGDVGVGALMTSLLDELEKEPLEAAPFPGLQGSPSAIPDPDTFQDDGAITWDSFKSQLTHNLLDTFGSDERPRLVADSGFSFVALSNVPVIQRGYVAQLAWAAIGYGVGATAGVNLANDDARRTVTVTGDGAFSQTVNALGTIAQLGQDAVVFVMDNRAFSVEQWLIDAHAFRPDNAVPKPPPFKPLTEIPQGHIWDYVKLAEGFGGRGHAVSTNAELREAIASLDDIPINPVTGEPTFTLIAVRVDKKSYPDLMNWRVAAG